MSRLGRRYSEPTLSGLFFSYARDIEATRDLPYSEKFADLLQLCEQGSKGEFETLIVAFLRILGDNYDELFRNLGQCAKAELLVAVAKDDGASSTCD